MGWILFLILLLLLIGAAPVWPYARGWGYYPAGVISTLLAIAVLLALLGIIPIELPNTAAR